MKITSDLLSRLPSHTRRKRDESLPDYLRRITHLYLQEKGIDELDNLQMCRNLAVLYLYDNAIRKIDNLSSLTNLTHLYLQNNRIARIENVSALKKLTKLYLGGNFITVVEGLEQVPDLRELHVENQHLPVGEKLLFDPRTLTSLKSSLCVLNVSGNCMDSLSEFSCLGNLMQLLASNNKIADMKSATQSLSRMKLLWRLELTHNPICHKAKYRERIIVATQSLVMLDGREVSELSRQFLLNWKASRESRDKEKQRSKEFPRIVAPPSPPFQALITSSRAEKDVFHLPDIFVSPRLRGRGGGGEGNQSEGSTSRTRTVDV